MNRFAPYAAFVMRLAVGGVFLRHGWQKLFEWGLAGTANFLHTQVGLPFAFPAAVVLTTVETLGAACVILGIFTRYWALCLAIDMAVAIFAFLLPHRSSFELEAMLFAGAITLVTLGDGPLSIGIQFKRGS